MGKNDNKEKKCHAYLYATEEMYNAAVVDFIANHNVKKVTYTNIYNDPWLYDFKFFGMEGPVEWYGSIYGPLFITDEDEYYHLGPWFESKYSIEENDYFERVMEAFELLTPRSDMESW